MIYVKILIIEGIATSGKSSLIKKLTELLGEQKLLVLGEPATHIPIMRKTDELHTEFFKSLIKEAIRADTDLVIFDRLHYTQAYRAKASIAEYSEVENLLTKHDTFLAYLQVDESAIAERVRLASEHRDKEWGDYVQTKGKTFDEIANYYIEQQRSQIALIKKSKLQTKIFNTTNHEYDAIAEDVAKIVHLSLY
jgi:thymidylate kinase